MTTTEHGTIVGPWTPDRIKDALHQSRRFVERALFALHYRQTPAQQEGQETGDHDHLGFNRWDKQILGDFARQMEESNLPEGHRLSDRQLRLAVVKLRKYAGQLSDIANRNVATEEEKRKRLENAAREICPECRDTRVVIRNFLGEASEVPCPRCGDTPYDQ